MADGFARKATGATVVQTIASRFAIIGLNAATGILTARLLAPEGRGELVAISIWPALVAGLTTLGLPTALVYHGRRDPARLGELTAAALALAIIAGLVGTAIAWALIPMWLRQHPPGVITAARFCLFGTVLNSMTLVGRAAWEARGDFRSSNLTQVAAPAMTIVGLVGLAATGHLTSVTAAIAYVVVSAPVLVWMLVGLRTHHPLARRGMGAESRQLLHYGARSYGVDLFGVLSVYLDQALVVGMLSPLAMGIYAVALSLARIISAVHVGLATLMLPTVIGYSTEALTAAIARSARLAAVVTAAIGLAIVAAGPLLVGLLYGGAYASAGALLPLLVLAMIVSGTVYVLIQGLLAAGRPGVVTLTQFVGLALGVPFFLVLVPASGAQGAAIALLASATIRLALVMACYPLWLRAPLPRIWIDRNDLSDLIGRVSSLLRTRPTTWLRTGAAE